MGGEGGKKRAVFTTRAPAAASALQQLGLAVDTCPGSGKGGDDVSCPCTDTAFSGESFVVDRVFLLVVWDLWSDSSQTATLSCELESASSAPHPPSESSGWIPEEYSPDLKLQLESSETTEESEAEVASN